MADRTLAAYGAALSQTIQAPLTRTANTQSALLRMLKVKPGRGKNVAVDFKGTGQYAENFAAGADVSTTGSNGVSQGTQTWGLYRATAVIEDLGAAASETSHSPTELLQPLADEVEDMTRKLAKTLNGVGYSGAGTGTTLAGLSIAIDDDNTYYGVDRSSGSNAHWRAKVIDPGSLTAPTQSLIRRDLGQIKDACGEKPDFALVNTATFNVIADLFEEKKRYPQDIYTLPASGRRVTMDSSVDAIVIDGCLFVADPDCTDAVIYYCNSNYLWMEQLRHVDVKQHEIMRFPLRDEVGNTGMEVVVYSTARTGAAEKLSMVVQLQLVVARPNAFGVRLNVKNT